VLSELLLELLYDYGEVVGHSTNVADRLCLIGKGHSRYVLHDESCDVCIRITRRSGSTRLSRSIVIRPTNEKLPQRTPVTSRRGQIRANAEYAAGRWSKYRRVRDGVTLIG